MSGPNVWPEFPGFKETVADYYAEILKLARRLIKLFALILELPEDFFDQFVSTPGAMGRLLHYPPQKANDPEALGIGAHTDIECFTILCQGKVPALQILNSKNEWKWVKPQDATLTINTCDALSALTGGYIKSTVHRVRAPPEDQAHIDRLGVLYFNR